MIIKSTKKEEEKVSIAKINSRKIFIIFEVEEPNYKKNENNFLKMIF